MTRRKGLWLVEETMQKYKNAWLEVSEHKVVRPDGEPCAFATVRMKPGVSVLAVDEMDKVYLTTEYRYAVERESIEVVSGGIDDDEPPPVAARRELREELGIEAAQWVNPGLVVHSHPPFIHLPHCSSRGNLVGLSLSLKVPSSSRCCIWTWARQY